MKMSGNCHIEGEAYCPFLQRPLFHSGYTGKSGEDTWWYCKHPDRLAEKRYIRNIKSCCLAGNKEAMKIEYLEVKAEKWQREKAEL